MNTRAKPAKAAAARPMAKAAPKRSRAALWVLAAAAAIAIGFSAYAGWSICCRAPDVLPTDPAIAGTESGLVMKVESLYNDIYLYRQGDGNFLLSFGAKRLRYVESVINPNDELDLPVEYTQSMVAGALAYPSELQRAAIIGLGGGRTSWYMHRSVPELSFTAVELDPEVARIADRFFSVRPQDNFGVEIKDGRVWLSRSDEKFDVILIDAYRGPFVPFHLLTTEFYKLVAEHLDPGGVAVQNVEPTTMLFDSAVATIKSAFEHTVFLSGEGNIVIVAYNGPEKDEATIQRIAAERQAKYGFRYPLPEMLTRRFNPPWNDKTAPLTDDFAPVEYLKAIVRHNARQG
ncbi:MAG: fused MFS/spermidine synthase [Bauldia sp.]|nr:fused MFS/spermidine synthase [Bauldia sp.]